MAYNHLDAIHGSPPGPIHVDSYLLCGRQLVSLPSHPEQTFDQFIQGLDPGMEPGAAMFFRQVLMLRSLAKRYERVVVLSFTPFYLWFFAKIGLGSRITGLHSEHSKGGRHHELAEERGRHGLREHLVRAAVWLNFLFADRAIFPSAGSVFLFQEMNPRLAGRVGRIATVVHNGVEPVALAVDTERSENTTFRIVSIAHHVREKGLDEVLAALTSSAVSGFPWTFVNYGSHSPMTAGLQSRAEELGIGSQVEFAGLKPQTEVRKALIEASAFLHLPVIVVFDLSLLEAMMCGTPVITTRLPGNVEALGEDYPLYATDAVEAGVKLRWLAEHPAEARKLGNDMRYRALAQFTKDSMARRYTKLLEQFS